MAGKHLVVLVTTHASAQPPISREIDVPIPPGYTQQDIDALTVRQIEDTAFLLTLHEFGRQPTRRALLAATARLRGIELVLDDPHDGIVPLALRIRAVLAVTNDEAIEAWGEDPDGP